MDTQQEFASYIKSKTKGFTKRKRKTLIIRENGRSTDFVAPGFATGCQLACSYCYVARHRDYGNPLEIYQNLDDIWDAIHNHYLSLKTKNPNQCDPVYWTYDIGESTDCMTPKVIKHTNWLVNKFLTYTDAKPSFATKLAAWSGLEPIVRERQARIRVSLAPQPIVDKTERLTSKVIDRIKSINRYYELGYEVHVNFSPIVIYGGWISDYINLFNQIKEHVYPHILKQLKCEVIFLTHNYDLHESNMKWIPESGLLWIPRWQEKKVTLRGDDSVVRYNQTAKPKAIQMFKEILSEHLPSCTIRYIF